MSAPAHQRTLILLLMQKADLDTRTITLMHTRYPGIGRDLVGTPVDAWLDRLSMTDASRAIDWLRSETGFGD